MSFWDIFRQKMRMLRREESGVALAYTACITLMLFVVAMSLAITGNVMRERIELQCAVDNAAYAGAVVQADCLSRMAVLNRALAWTYVQTNRLHTDYIMNRYADDCLKAYKAVAEKSDYMSDIYAKDGENKWKVTLSALQKAAATSDSGRYSYQTLSPAIRQASTTMATMNRALSAAVNHLPATITAAVESAFKTNCETQWSIGSGDYPNCCCIVSDASGCFTTYPSETDFLKNAYREESKYDDASWQTLHWWRESPEDSLAGGGFSRLLEPVLSLTATGYKHIQGVPVRITATITAGSSYSTHTKDGAIWQNDAVGGYGTSALWGRCEAARPQRLTAAFFGRQGAIVVGASKPMTNPFKRWMNRTLSRHNLFDEVGSGIMGTMPICAVAASRAGYRLQNDPDGAYRTTWHSGGDESDPLHPSKWNLCIDDWDAVMLPIAKAWQNGIDYTWQKSTSPKEDTDSFYTRQLMTEVAQRLNIDGSLLWGIDASHPFTRGGEIDVLH